MNKLTEIFQPRCKHRHTARTHPKCFGENGKPLTDEEKLEIGESKVLIFDVETLPIVAYAWKVWDENISEKQIIKDWCILSWSAKWLNDNKILSDVLTPKEAVYRDDKRLISSFWKLIDEADVVIAHNGKRFDIKKVNTRFWKHKLNKPSSYKVVDTLTSVKSVFSLNHNSQNSVAKFLEIQEKLDTDFSLWAACDRGDSRALKYMLEYNEQDVRMLETIYLEMREWIPNHPDLRVYNNVDGCPVCLEGNHTRLEFYVANSKKYPEFRCNSCGAVWHSSKAIKE
jgi:DNA polymerase elongation subunit (family B)